MRKFAEKENIKTCASCGLRLYDVKFCSRCKRVIKVFGNKDDAMFCSKCRKKLSDRKACLNCWIILKTN